MAEKDQMMSLNLPDCDVRVRSEAGKPFVYDPLRRKYVRLTPEEWVRQHFLQYLMHDCGYPGSLIAVEMGFAYQDMPRRADIVVHDRQGAPFLMAECKAPDVGIDQSTFDQVARYNLVVDARYLAVTNGMQHYCWRTDRATGRHEFLNGVPSFDAVSIS